MGSGNVRKYKSGKGHEVNGRHKDSRDRRSRRKAELGKVFENSVMVSLLEKMKEDRLISDFIHHSPNSAFDRAGKDFTVFQSGDPEPIARSFGVTTSFKSQKESLIKHPGVPQFFFPPETKPETMQKRILNLFK